MKVVIAGAGYVGSALAARLAEAGHEVWALRRSASHRTAPHGSAHERIHEVVANVATGVGLEQLPEAADAIVYAVAPDDSSDAAYQDAYPRGVLRMRERQPNARFLLVSSTSVYGQDAGEWVDETTPVDPPTASSRRIVEAENLVLEGPRDAVVRASGIYGPGRTGLLDRVQRGEARLPQSPIYTNRIHRDDLAGALEFLLARPELGGCFVATDTEPVELGQLLAWLAARLDVPSPELESGTSEPRTRHRYSRRCLPHRLTEAGFSWRYPTFREGYAELLDELKSAASS